MPSSPMVPKAMQLLLNSCSALLFSGSDRKEQGQDQYTLFWILDFQSKVVWVCRSGTHACEGLTAFILWCSKIKKFFHGCKSKLQNKPFVSDVSISLARAYGKVLRVLNFFLLARDCFLLGTKEYLYAWQLQQDWRGLIRNHRVFLCWGVKLVREGT